MKQILLMLLSALSLGAAAESYVLPAHFWLNARSGEAVTKDATVAQVVQRLTDHPRSLLRIHHTREDESVAHAEELRGWLIALGVEADRISLSGNRIVASTADRLLTMEVIENK